MKLHNTSDHHLQFEFEGITYTAPAGGDVLPDLTDAKAERILAHMKNLPLRGTHPKPHEAAHAAAPVEGLSAEDRPKDVPPPRQDGGPAPSRPPPNDPVTADAGHAQPMVVDPTVVHPSERDHDHDHDHDKVSPAAAASHVASKHEPIPPPMHPDAKHPLPDAKHRR